MMSHLGPVSLPDTAQAALTEPRHVLKPHGFLCDGEVRQLADAGPLLSPTL